MPINAQRNSSNTNKPQSRQNIFFSQSHASLESRLPTPGLVNASPRATNSHPAGAPRALPLDVEGTFDISRDFARLPADRPEKHTNAVPTQTHESQQGRGHLLQNGEGVPPAGQSANFIPPFGMTAPRPRAQAYLQSEGEPIKRGVPIDPDKLHTATYDKRSGLNCAPVLLLIDEAGRTAIPSLADHATTVVGRGVSLWVAVQSLSQLDAVYGKVRAQVLRDNMESQLYYRPSNHETAEYLERCLGRVSEYAHNQTAREGSTVSLGLSEQGVPLLTAQEIKQMRDQDIIGFHRRLPPFQGNRMDWRRFPTLIQRRNLPPPSLPALPKLQTQPAETETPLYIDPDSLD